MIKIEINGQKVKCGIDGTPIELAKDACLAISAIYCSICEKNQFSGRNFEHLVKKVFTEYPDAVFHLKPHKDEVADD